VAAITLAEQAWSDFGGKMLVGHFAVAFVGKRIEPGLSLGTLVMAAMFADLLWCVFMIAGVEHVKFQAGKGAGNYIAALDVPLSHSLLMDVVWSALFAGIYFLLRRRRFAAFVLFSAVLSHWLLDFISHKPDMSLAPGSSSHFGLGLWTSLPATIIVEGGFWVIAIVIYVRMTKAKGRLGFFVFWIAVLLWTLAWYGNIAGSPPPSDTAAIRSLVFFSLVIGWAYWTNRLRSVKS
jgi:hypothetical protein